MNDEPVPKWDLLPYRAEEFFDLSEDFDVRDLKRSYNRLIRKFKPEKFPDEFQRIRAAYEQLNDARRYNLPTRRPTAVEPSTFLRDEQEFNGQSASVEDPDHGVTSPPRQQLWERVATTPIADLYQELKSSRHKSPNDYTSLALLSDIVSQDAARPNDDSFVGWLLAGIAHYEDDRGLIELLRATLCEDHALTELTDLLLRAVDVLPPQRFQYATERAWDRLIREAPFEDFRNCFHRCGSKLSMSVDHSQLVFYIHILRLAMWKADDAFLEDLQQTLDDHFESLDEWAQTEYEVISSLLEYRTDRESFISRGPCCNRIDQAIRDWCELNEVEGDLSVLDCQYFLSLRGHRIFEEFPDVTSDRLHVLFPWDLIVSDVLERVSAPPERDEGVIAKHAYDFMVRITRRNDRTLERNIGIAAIIAAPAAAVITLVVFASLCIRMCMKAFGEQQWLSALLDGGLAVVVLCVGFVASLIVFVWGQKLRRLRYQPARTELLKLVRVTGLNVIELAAFIRGTEDQAFGEDETINDTKIIAAYMQCDAGIELFSLAQVALNTVAPETIAAPQYLEPVVAEDRPPNKPVGRRLT